MKTRRPFNVELLELNKRKVQNLPTIKVLDVMEGGTNNLHPEGLFSTEYFGRKGEPTRLSQFGVIDMKAEVLHPVLYDAFSRLKSLYKGIMDGTEYAVWDKKEQDFERSNEIDGQTGYSFFIRHMGDIKLKSTGSAEREDRIKVIKQNLDRALTQYLLVLPPGYRDVEEDKSGRVKKDEINKKYMRILGISNLLHKESGGEGIDSTRKTLQSVFNEIYLYLKNLLEGKGGMLMSKYASRTVFNGTRNVITSKNTVREHLHAPNKAGNNDTGVGLYQLMKAILPVAKFHIRNFMADRFISEDGSVKAVNPKTWKSEYIAVDTDEVDMWTTSEGVEKVIRYFKDDAVRHRPVMLGAHYAYLVYDDGKHFKVFDDIDQLPEGFSKEFVRPISLVEMCYLAYYKGWNRYRGWVTRFPVTGAGSVYPTRVYVHTTSTGRLMTALGDDWEPTDDVALEYPTPGDGFMNALVPDTTHLVSLGADFDGDMCSLEVCYSENGIREIEALLTDPLNYLDPAGGFRNSVSTDTVDLVLFNLTGEPKHVTA